MDSYQYRDQLSIDTPEQVSLSFPIAGLGSRILAHLADLALETAVYLVIVLLGALAFSGPISSALGKLSDQQGKWLVAGLVFVNFLFFWGYYTLFEAFWNGQTPGKRWIHLRVIKDSGRQITFFEALTRNLVRVVDLMPSMYIAGIITILVSKQNQRLGDLLAGTIVVRQELTALAPAGHSSRTFTEALVSTPSAPAMVDHGIEFDPIAISRLTNQDLMIVEAFFARIPELDVDTTDRIATNMLGSLCRKMQIEVPTSVSCRRSLDAIAHALRDIAIYRR